MVVVDASVIVEWLLRLPVAGVIDRRLADESLHAPHLLTVEVVQVLRRYSAVGDLGPGRATEALDDLAAIDVRRHDHEPLVAAMWRWRANLTMYDATYVALAEALDCPLVTLDRRLAAAPAHPATIELIEL